MSSSSTSTLHNMHSQSAMSSSYSNERSIVGGGAIGNIEIEYASDPASGGFFHADYKKHDDLKQMLDSNKDSLKLEAMKRIISMVAKGKDASDLFPAVVKNVVSKNIEVKKLVYVYLVRYAEEQQDLALLSISTFQRALKDPNQLIRAGALRVLSSIRVSMIVPIVMLAIRDSASDMSPYVRKTAAHAIPKLFSLDVEQKDELITVIEKLLYDRTTLVVGSAVMAFEEVCPERVDLIHKNYRKLCNLLVDVDEWGQIIIINMLTRYARTQFIDPNADHFADSEETGTKAFYDESNSDGSDNETSEKNTKSPRSVPTSLDPDHRLLLRQTKPLLQSRNASVVMTVAQLYHHVAPRNEVALVAKALIRLLRSHKEVQSVVLTSIASMSTQRKCIFDVYMKSFFVRTSDATHIKLLKLEILTNLATVTSISVILREFQTYISSNDKEFVAATIQAIGRCAASIKEVTETCLSGLVHLLSNRDEYVVAESVVVIKQLLQTQAADHFEIISQMAKLLDFITVPAARAAILWLIGEYNDKVPNIAPDVLRKLAKTYCDEEHIVKLQVLNLAVKLNLTNPGQTELLCQYVINLARYDQNYDIRDRARLLKHFVSPPNGTVSTLTKHAKMIFLAAKPAPQLESKYHGREQYQLGSLSHYLNMRANGYHDIPDFPDVAPDASQRNVEAEPTTRDDVHRVITTNCVDGTKSDSEKVAATEFDRSFYTDSDDNQSSEYTSSSSSDDDSDDQKSVQSTATSDKKKNIAAATSDESNSDDSSYSDDDTTSSFSESGTGSSSEASHGEPRARHEASTNGSNEKSNLDLLLDMHDAPKTGTILTPSMGFEPALVQPNRINPVDPAYISSRRLELLSKMNGNGLAIQYRFTRAPHIISATMVSIELYITNTLEHDLNNLKFTIPVGGGNTSIDVCPIAVLPAGETFQTIAGVDFNDSPQPIQLLVEADTFRGVRATLKPSVGELVRPVTMSEQVFAEERSKLRGMNEQSASIDLTELPILDTNDFIKNRILEHSNLANIPADRATNRLHFAAKTMTSGGLVLLTAEIGLKSVTLTVSCEQIMIGSMLLTELRSFLLKPQSH